MTGQNYIWLNITAAKLREDLQKLHSQEKLWILLHPLTLKIN